ncbi:O-antigen ligase like membrane protein [Modicisalibacter xianhensis]|uniref:O-antigen ligase like membrane protein n=1 Tax=Modicisalibacter xianhensis TaxID=442341 RepID=A0A1I3C0D7_9GAMM|nr:O-antigen ligase like membrane protein [Halomonas xianhensis]
MVLTYSLARISKDLFAGALCVVALSPLWYLLFLTEGRSGFLSITVAMLLTLVLLRRQALLPVTLTGLAVLPALAGWWWLNPFREPESGEVFTRDITKVNDRLVLWSDALRYSIENFPFGIGPMQFAGDGHIRNASAHNIFLNTAAEWGLPLALALLGLVLYGCWVIVKRSRTMPDQDKPIYACLVMAFVGVMVNAQFSGSHIAPLSSLVMVLAIGAVFGYRDSSQPVPVVDNTSSRGVGPTILWLVMMLALIYLIWAGLELYGLAMESKQRCFEEIGRPYLYPRFWSQGRLECMQMVEPNHWLFSKWSDWL